MATRKIYAQFVALLVEEYKALPSLWDIDSEAYKNKHIKRADYNSLLNTMIVVDPLLTMDELKKKIAKLRTSYRRELKKVTESIKSGSEVYVPSLSYFKQMDFLRNKDQEPRLPEPEPELEPEYEPEPEISDIYNEYDVADDEIESLIEWKPVIRKIKPKPRISKQHRKSFVKRNTFLNKPAKCLDVKQHPNPTNKDEASVFSDTWAVLFRKLSHEQQLFGKRCIDEILYQGQLGNLSSSSYRNLQLSLNDSVDARSSTPQQQN